MTRDQLLQLLSQIESGGGKNFNHPVITHGPDQGTQAAGRYGLTNSTIDDTVKNNPSLRNMLSQMDPASKKQYIESHPDVEQNIAGSLADRLLKRYGGDENKVAYAWNHGSYLNPNRITPDIIAQDDYTNKFQKLKGRMAGAAPEDSGAPVQQKFVQQQNKGGITDPENKYVANKGMSLEDIINDPSNPFNQKDEDEDQDSTDMEELKKRLANNS